MDVVEGFVWLCRLLWITSHLLPEDLGDSPVPDFIIFLALMAVILTVSGLISGIVERSPISFPLIFLGLGYLVGQYGLGIIDVSLHDPIIQMVATLALCLIFFLEALKLRIKDLGKGWLVPLLILGPGTALMIAFGAVPFVLLLGFGWSMAFIGGAVLASTDLVVVRSIFRNENIPNSIRQILTLEAGMNDIIVLPVMLLLTAILQGRVETLGEWPAFLARLLVMAPAVGFSIGAVGAWLMSRIDGRFNIRLEFQSLFALGLAFASYTASATVGSSGFLGVFACGVGVMLFNRKLTNSFLEYGQVTSEIAMLIMFVLFGALLPSIIGSIAIVPAVLLALVTVFVVRPSVMGLILTRARMSPEAHAVVSWFGARGLDSVLLAMLVVEAGIPGSETLLAAVGVTALVSLTIHGATAAPVGAWYGRKAASQALAEKQVASAVGLFKRGDGEVPALTPERLSCLLAIGSSVIVLDVRPFSSYQKDRSRIPGSIRILSERVMEQLTVENRDTLVVVYCDSRGNTVSLRVAQHLRSLGVNAVVLKGGLTAWRASYPIESAAASV